jgi:hypothetical protein
MFVGALVGTSVAKEKQTAQPKSNGQYLYEIGKRFLDYEDDFLTFAKSHKDEEIEFEILSDLRAIADMNQERLDAAAALAALFNTYENMSCEKDRVFVKSHLIIQLLHDAKNLDFDVKSVNNDHSHTKLPAVAQTAARMKDDLRDVRAKFDALQASLK